MKLRDLFAAEITRDIPPVVYFHEQSPAKLQSEVSEYVVTGGYAEEDPRAQEGSGIHEQLVHLLRGIAAEMRKPGGPELPACWISGCFGSGKSSFAKLLGLALDGVTLPDGRSLSTALLQRDASPRRQELVDAWEALAKQLAPIAVVFDIGGVAHDQEHLHAAALRMLQARLGYCAKSHHVAEFELRLERDGEWAGFVQTANKTLGEEWALAKRAAQAEDHFSHVLHVMKPARYPEPTSWIDSRAGASAGTSVREVVDAIDAMLRLRAPGQTLFFVVDEVSQYVHEDDDRRLALQSFISELGQRLGGRVWLMATGQQKLDDHSEHNPVGKLRDRFPTHLRVHLGATTIRDVVTARLLQKKPEHVAALRELFQQHRGDLKLYGYASQELSEDEFVEAYPLLPGYFDLLMQVTSNLRSRRMHGEEPALRGLLQLLGALFRVPKLADGVLGALVTMDVVCMVLHQSLDAERQDTLERLLRHAQVCDDEIAQRVAKAVTLLELVQEHTATTPELVAACLHAQLGDGNGVPAVRRSLEKLVALGLLSHSERQGFALQSAAGQEWQRERDDLGSSRDQLSAIMQRSLKALLGGAPGRATKWKGRSFSWTLWFSDGREASDVKLQDVREESSLALDVRYLARQEDREAAMWVAKSDQEPLRNRVLWIAAAPDAIEQHARQLGSSARMLDRYRARRESLGRETQRLLLQEEARYEALEARLRSALADSLLLGMVYFRGQPIRPRDVALTFGAALGGIATRVLPDLYPHFSELSISPKELEPLLDKDVAGPSTKLMDAGLGILALDAGQYVASCTGLVPTRIAQVIEASGGVSGQSLLTTFASAPYGYAPELVKVCCAGLLRGKKIRVRTEQGTPIDSHLDPGVRELFGRDRDFRRAELLTASQPEVSGKDRIAIRKLLQKYLHVEQEPEDEPIADTVFQHFWPARDSLGTFERQVAELPGRPALPPALQKFGRALEDCCRSRSVQQTVSEVKRNLVVLRDGFEELAVLRSELTPQAIDILHRAAQLRDMELAQLRQHGVLSELEADSELLTMQLSAERPWREVTQLTPALERIRTRYVEARAALLREQSERVDAAVRGVESRRSFARLDAERARRVLRPIRDLLLETTAEAVTPSLSELRDGFASRVHAAAEAALDTLDRELRQGEPQVVHVELQLRGREIENRAQLEALLSEVEQRVAPLLTQGMRVRLGS